MILDLIDVFLFKGTFSTSLAQAKHCIMIPADVIFPGSTWSPMVTHDATTDKKKKHYHTLISIWKQDSLVNIRHSLSFIRLLCQNAKRIPFREIKPVAYSR